MSILESETKQKRASLNRLGNKQKFKVDNFAKTLKAKIFINFCFSVP